MESWRPIPGYDSLYEASSLGRVRSLDRRDPAGRSRRGRLLKLKTTKTATGVFLCPRRAWSDSCLFTDWFCSHFLDTRLLGRRPCTQMATGATTRLRTSRGGRRRRTMKTWQGTELTGMPERPLAQGATCYRERTLSSPRLEESAWRAPGRAQEQGIRAERSATWEPKTHTAGSCLRGPLPGGSLASGGIP